MTGRGRPSTGTRIEVRVPDRQLAAIDQQAAQWGVSRSEALRRILTELVP